MTRAALALLLAGCALELETPATSALACGLDPNPGHSEAPQDACKIVWATGSGKLSRSSDVCDDGVSCLVLQPGERALKFIRPGAPDGQFWMLLDPSCAASCP